MTIAMGQLRLLIAYARSVENAVVVNQGNLSWGKKIVGLTSPDEVWGDAEDSEDPVEDQTTSCYIRLNASVAASTQRHTSIVIVYGQE